MNKGNNGDDLFNYLQEFSNTLTKIKNNQETVQNQYNNNMLTDYNQNLFKERYPDYANQDIFSEPPVLSYPSESGIVEIQNKDNEKSLGKILEFIEKHKVNEKYKKILDQLNIFKWMKSYSIFSGNEIQSVDLTLNKLKEFSIDSEQSSTLCEVKDICVVDCIQVLTVIDAKLNYAKLILIKDEKENIKNSNENLNLIINDYFFKVGDILIFNLKNKEKVKNQYFKLNLKEITIMS